MADKKTNQNRWLVRSKQDHYKFCIASLLFIALAMILKRHDPQAVSESTITHQR